MTNSSFGLRQIAYSYCRFVSQLFGFLGLDGYEIFLTMVLLAAFCCIALLASGRARAAVDRLCPPWLYCLLLICALFIVRLPTFLPNSMNPDEGMFVAGAMKLRYDPVFWRSLDGATSGPLNYYPLTLLNILGLPLDFATARLLNVICIGGAIAVVYRIARLFMPDWAARLTPLPALAAVMAFRSIEFLHYSSECVSVLLIAFGAWLLFAEAVSPRSHWLRGFGIGVIVVLLPLAKLQAAPIAVAIAVGGLANAFFWRQGRKWKEAFWISAGVAAAFVALLFFLVGFGVFGTFQQAYITENLRHANMFPPLPLERFVKYWWPPDLRWYEGGILVFLIYVLGSSYYPRMRREGIRKALNHFAFCDLFVVLILAASLYAIYRPHREFAHYLVFLIIPLALVGVRTLAQSLGSAKNGGAGSRHTAVRSAILFVLTTLALPCLLRSSELSPTFEFENWMTLYRAHIECPVCQLIGHFTKPGAPVAIWGWAPELYVLTGTIPATHDTHMPLEFMTLPQQDYYRRRFLEDLQLYTPKVFIDAVGPGEFSYQDRDAYGFETFPELRQYIARNFYLAGENNAASLPYMRGVVGGVRVFVRKDASDEINLPFRIKCGSDTAVSDEAGNEWKPDVYFEGGKANQLQASEDIGELPPLYRSERVCATTCKYFVPIHNGTYLVRMYFAELEHSGANRRLFDVEVNQDAITLDLDIFRAAHGRAKPYVLERRTTVSDHGLQISLIPRLNQATISAIEILPALEPPASNLQVNETTESETGPLIDPVKWKADPAWTLNSQYAGAGTLAAGQMWSSYGGDDKKTGRIIAGPITPSSPGCLVLPIAHGPSVAHLSVIFLDVPSGQQIGLVPLNPARLLWQFYEIHYSPTATVRLVATDRGAGWGQWLAVGQPRSCK